MQTAEYVKHFPGKFGKINRRRDDNIIAGFDKTIDLLHFIVYNAAVILSALSAVDAGRNIFRIGVYNFILTVKLFGKFLNKKSGIAVFSR